MTLWIFLLSVPVMVIVYIPDGVLEEVEIVSVELKLSVPEDGLKLAVALRGRPEADRRTVLLKPKREVTVTIALVDPPAVISADVGFTLMAKSITVRV